MTAGDILLAFAVARFALWLRDRWAGVDRLDDLLRAAGMTREQYWTGLAQLAVLALAALLLASLFVPVQP